eukprot:PLAT13454.1.p2 GENE.PLAT13454.1~~PLAT13454.1.p2  ORF type:complete len:475 (+),score=234.79 PLAT13454.1:3-1427(+)
MLRIVGRRALHGAAVLSEAAAPVGGGFSKLMEELRGGEDAVAAVATGEERSPDDWSGEEEVDLLAEAVNCLRAAPELRALQAVDKLLASSPEDAPHELRVQLLDYLRQSAREEGGSPWRVAGGMDAEKAHEARVHEELDVLSDNLVRCMESYQLRGVFGDDLPTSLLDLSQLSRLVDEKALLRSGELAELGVESLDALEALAEEDEETAAAVLAESRRQRRSAGEPISHADRAELLKRRLSAVREHNYYADSHGAGLPSAVLGEAGEDAEEAAVRQAALALRLSDAEWSASDVVDDEDDEFNAKVARILPAGFSHVSVFNKRHAKPTKAGRVFSQGTAVVVGNGFGGIGMGWGRGTEAEGAELRAVRAAAKRLVYVPLFEGRTPHCELHGEYNNIRVSILPAPRGSGNACRGILRTVTELAGMEDVRGRVYGRASPMTTLKAVFEALADPKSGSRLDNALARGKKLQPLMQVYR